MIGKARVGRSEGGVPYTPPTLPLAPAAAKMDEGCVIGGAPITGPGMSNWSVGWQGQRHEAVETQLQTMSCGEWYRGALRG